jgi:hypothetical protein
MKRYAAVVAFALGACAPTVLDSSYVVRDADAAISIAKASATQCIGGGADHWEAAFKEGAWHVKKFGTRHDSCNWGESMIDARTGVESSICSVCITAD